MAKLLATFCEKLPKNSSGKMGEKAIAKLPCKQ